jgi:periplasmic protein CpxP/Spy
MRFGVAVAIGLLALAPVARGQGMLAADSAAQPLRPRLEQQIRQRFAQVVRNRLGLTDSQMLQLRETNRKFSERRRALGQQERQLRMALQGELRPGVGADQEHVSALMDSLLTIQRDRLDLLQDEQRDLSAFMTPVQRVQYYGLQEQLRKRLQAFQQRAAAPPF